MGLSGRLTLFEEAKWGVGGDERARFFDRVKTNPPKNKKGQLTGLSAT